MNDSKAERRFISVRRQEEIFTWKSTIRRELKIIYTFLQNQSLFQSLWFVVERDNEVRKADFQPHFLHSCRVDNPSFSDLRRFTEMTIFSALKHRYSFLSLFWNCNRPQSVIQHVEESLIQVELIMEKGKHLLLLHWFKSRLLRKQKLEVVCGKAISSTACSALSFRLHFLFHNHQHLHWKASFSVKLVDSPKSDWIGKRTVSMAFSKFLNNSTF